MQNNIKFSDNSKELKEQLIRYINFIEHLQLIKKLKNNAILMVPYPRNSIVPY